MEIDIEELVEINYIYESFNALNHWKCVANRFSSLRLPILGSLLCSIWRNLHCIFLYGTRKDHLMPSKVFVIAVVKIFQIFHMPRNLELEDVPNTLLFHFDEIFCHWKIRKPNDSHFIHPTFWLYYLWS